MADTEEQPQTEVVEQQPEATEATETAEATEGGEGGEGGEEATESNGEKGGGKGWGNGGGKGGFGGGWGAWSMFDMWNMMGKGGGWGKGFGKPRRPSGPDLKREVVQETPMTGKVHAWKGKYGFIEPDGEIDHPKASKNGGKIYVSMSDIKGEKLDEGDSVQFVLYSDESGLGAQDVISL